MVSRVEHLNWCKKRANQYLDNGEVQNAITSMLSDLCKHDETKNIAEGPMAMVGILVATGGDKIEARHFIDGFN